MAATAALSAATVADLSPAGANEFAALTVTLALTVGVIALVAGLLRLGFLASFISEPVLKGFIVGLALTIIIGQVPKLLGVEKEDGDFFEQLWHLLGELGSTSGITLLVGLSSLVLVVENPCDPDRPAGRGTGLGLRNVRERLHSEYGDEAALQAGESGGRFIARLELPAGLGRQ